MVEIHGASVSDHHFLIRFKPDATRTHEACLKRIRNCKQMVAFE